MSVMQIAATLSPYLPVSRLVYGINGESMDVPLEPRAYPQGLCKSHWGLNEVPCVESYKGLIFGNMGFRHTGPRGTG
ncbi:hypothetical protein ACLK17_15525 [Escherichia coli]